MLGNTRTNCGLSDTSYWNLESVCGRLHSKYFKLFETANIIDIQPRFSRMTCEQKKTNTEKSTNNHEVSLNMVHLFPRSTVDSNVCRAENIEKRTDITGQQNGNITKKSAFVPYTKGLNTLKSGLTDSVKSSEKRKLETLLLTGNHISELGNSRKRFKNDKGHSIYKRDGLYNELQQPFYLGDKPIYYGPSYKNDDPNLSELNGISKHVSRQLPCSFNTVSSDKSKFLYMAGMTEEETNLTFNSRTNPTELESNSTRVGETELTHPEHSDESISKKGIPNNMRVEYKKIERSFSSNSREFISLDSTKSSFLTLMKEMRKNVEPETIPCPFCSQIFSKYSDLKIHVQTHKYDKNSGHSGLQLREISNSGNNVLTSVSSLTTLQCPSNRRQSVEDDSLIRATSVIQFAEKKDIARK